MALLKNIELDNGVVVNYHRIVSVNTVTNVQNIIEVASYISEAKRNEEIAAIANGQEMNVYIHTQFFNANFERGMSVSTAYDWLMENVPMFEGAEPTDDISDEVTGDEFISMIEEVL